MEADMTRVALIPPLTRVGDINKYGRGVQLVLPHLWNASVRYRDAYVQAASNGDLMIVDNGAFEGEVRDISVCMPDTSSGQVLKRSRSSCQTL
jgi:hypothetical protein